MQNPFPTAGNIHLLLNPQTIKNQCNAFGSRCQQTAQRIAIDSFQDKALLPIAVSDDKINLHKTEPLRFPPYDVPFGTYTAHLIFIPHTVTTMGISVRGLPGGFVCHAL
jgi:hypothetical protein